MSRWKHWMDRESRTVASFVQASSSSLPDGSLVLDAGAGGSPYGPLFARQRYVTTDVPLSFNSGVVDVFSDISLLPFQTDSFDYAVCTQVLEHVPDPARVISELQRVLKPGGKLFLTAPQGWGIHNEPWHFFNFTVYGLRKLFTEARFDIESIHPREGSLSYLGYRVHTIPRKILRQYRRDARLWEERAFTPELPAWKYRIARFATQPFFLLLDILASLLILADRWDCEKRFTLGYACVVRKPLPRVCK